MTAPDPRVGEIRARLDAATPGPWVFDGTEIDNIPDYESENPAPWKSIMECRVDCMSYCYGGSVAMDIGSDDRALIENAPADVAYLLAELADRDEKLAKVEGAMTAVHGEMDGGDLENYCSHDGDEYPCETVTALRAAVSAAKGGGE